MSLSWEQVTVDSIAPVDLGQWWCAALDWIVVDDDPQAFEIRPSVDQMPGLLFLASTELKSTKNRLHIDLRPDDRDAEVDRLIELGASRIDIGQGDASWVVLADPENNEFCILSAL
ncbi:MAG: hypothetical protein ACI8Y4_004904 [Candidatus Poriferisodalaceae bacterium]